jgi:hypothetical protein
MGVLSLSSSSVYSSVSFNDTKHKFDDQNEFDKKQMKSFESERYGPDSNLSLNNPLSEVNENDKDSNKTISIILVDEEDVNDYDEEFNQPPYLEQRFYSMKTPDIQKDQGKLSKQY